MTYFHTGIRTIIGAEAFHGPVRDGKAWGHLAMAARHKLVKLQKPRQRVGPDGLCLCRLKSLSWVMFVVALHALSLCWFGFTPKATQMIGSSLTSH